MRKNLRKTYKLLERDGFAFALRVTEGPDDVAAAMTRFFALHAARAEAADMLFHPNRFVQPHVRAFFADYLHRAAERGELRIFELEIGGIVVASRIAFLLGSDLYMYFAGYDPAWKNYSVMTVLMTEMIQMGVRARGRADQPVHRSRPVEDALEAARGAFPRCRAGVADHAGPGGIRGVPGL